MNISIRSTLIAVALCVQGAAAGAATLTYDVRSAADERQNSVPGKFQQRKVDTPVQLGDNIGIEVDTNDGRPLSSAGLNINAATGQVKFGANAFAQGRTGQFNGSNASAISEFELTEVFATTGSGSVTFFVDIDGSLTRNGPITSSNARIDAKLSGFAVGNRPQEDRMFATTGSLGDGAHLIDQRLSVTLNVAGSNNVRLVFGGAAGAQAVVQTITATHETTSDFFNTATISFITTGDLALTASDPNFLSGGDISSPAAVPLPASMPLLIGAFGVIAALGRRRRKA